jgi:hypothetical protein
MFFFVVPVRQREHVSVVVVPETPRFLRLHSQQLSVAVPRVVLDVGVRIDSHVSRVGPRLRDPAVHVVTELHPEHLHSVDGERHLRLQEAGADGSREESRSVVHLRLVVLRLVDLEQSDHLQSPGLPVVRQVVLGEVLAAYASLRGDQPVVIVVVVGELGVAQSCFGTEVDTFLHQETADVLVVPSVLQIGFHVGDLAGQAGGFGVVVEGLAVAVHHLLQPSVGVVPVDHPSAFARVHGLEESARVGEVLQVGTEAAGWGVSDPQETQRRLQAERVAGAARQSHVSQTTVVVVRQGEAPLAGQRDLRQHVPIVVSEHLRSVQIAGDFREQSVPVVAIFQFAGAPFPGIDPVEGVV